MFLVHDHLTECTQRANSPWMLSQSVSDRNCSTNKSTLGLWWVFFFNFFSIYSFMKNILVLQSLSPGLVKNDIITYKSTHDIIKLMPHLDPVHVANALMYIITTPDNVLVSFFFKFLFMCYCSWLWLLVVGISLIILLFCLSSNFENLFS